jgi:hypothetical protein
LQRRRGQIRNVPEGTLLVFNSGITPQEILH